MMTSRDCSVVDDIWSSCGNHGKCNVNDTSTCICEDGYQHDMSFTRSRDCRLFDLYLPIFEGLVGSILVIESIVCLIQLIKPYIRCGKAEYIKTNNIPNARPSATDNTMKPYRRSSIATRMALSVALYSSCISIFCGVRFYENHQLGPISLIFLYLSDTFLIVSSNLIIQVAMIPLYAASYQSTKALSRWQISLFILMRVVIIIPLYYCYLYVDSSNPSNDAPFNKYTSIMIFLIVLELCGLNVIAHISGNNMVKLVLSVAESPGRFNRATELTEFAKKVKSFVTVAKRICIASFIIIVVYVGLQLSKPAVPYIFVFYSLSLLLCPTLTLAHIIFFQDVNTKRGNISTASTSGHELAPRPLTI